MEVARREFVGTIAAARRREPQPVSRDPLLLSVEATQSAIPASVQIYTLSQKVHLHSPQSHFGNGVMDWCDAFAIIHWTSDYFVFSLNHPRPVTEYANAIRQFAWREKLLEDCGEFLYRRNLPGRAV